MTNKMSKVIPSTTLSREHIEVVSPTTIEIIRTAAENSKNPEIRVTSTIRTPVNQARAMFNNLESGIRINYRNPGKQVIAVYDRGKKEQLRDTAIMVEMREKIEELAREGQLVSRHCVPIDMYMKRNILDVSGRIPNPRDFVKELLKDERVKKIITPFASDYNASGDRLIFDPHEPAIHIEIEP